MVQISETHNLAVALTLSLAVCVAGGMAGVAHAQDMPPIEGYDGLLRKHVDRQGMVDYRALSRETAALDRYITSLAQPMANDAPADDKLARFINAYNAFTLRLILDYHDDGKLTSIMNIPEDKRWKHKRWTLDGKLVSLDEIEHKLIRTQFDEPRIHWALVCAAVSCPPLRREAYVGDTLEKQLADQERRVLDVGDERFIKIDGKTVAVTRLFQWYAKDFRQWQKYIRRRHVLDYDVTFEYLEYDWQLNAQCADTPGDDDNNGE